MITLAALQSNNVDFSLIVKDSINTFNSDQAYVEALSNLAVNTWGYSHRPPAEITQSIIYGFFDIDKFNKMNHLMRLRLSFDIAHRISVLMDMVTENPREEALKTLLDKLLNNSVSYFLTIDPMYWVVAVKHAVGTHRIAQFHMLDHKGWRAALVKGSRYYTNHDNKQVMFAYKKPS